MLAGALALPLSAPVPEEYAEKFDASEPVARMAMNQVATGPYMIENDTSGKAIGYEAGRRIHLVRNPNWDAATDYKPAYVDEIEMPQGNDDTTVSSRKILEGEGMLSGDWSVPPAVLAQVVKREKDQLALVPVRQRALRVDEHDGQAVRRRQRAQGRGRRLQPRGAAPGARRRARSATSRPT